MMIVKGYCYQQVLLSVRLVVDVVIATTLPYPTIAIVIAILVLVLINPRKMKCMG